MLIKVKVNPGTTKRKITKKNSDEFLIDIKNDPIQGRANREVREILSQYFQVSKSNIRLKRGFKRPNKIFEIIGK